MNIVFLLVKDKYRLLLLVLYTILIAVYSFNLSDFYMVQLDDDFGLFKNPLVQELSFENLKKIWLNDTLDVYYLPTTFTSFAIDVSIWGSNPYVMKILNTVYFIICSVLLYRLLLLFGISHRVAALTVIMFTFHPLQVQNITWVVCRRQTLSMLFILLASINYIKYFINNKEGGFRKYYWLSVFAYFFAMGAKPSSIVFLPMLVLILMMYRWNKSQIKELYNKDLIDFSPFLLVTVFFIFMNINASQRNHFQEEYGYSVWQHFLIIASSFGFYIDKIFKGPYLVLYSIPHESKFIYKPYIIHSILAFILLCAGMIWGVLRKEKFFIAVFWYFLALIPSALLVLVMEDFRNNTADRYFLLSSPAIFYLFAVLLDKIFKKYSVIFVLILIIPCLITNVKQIKIWNDTSTLLEYNYKITPSVDLNYRLAMLYFSQGEKVKSYGLLKKSKDLPDQFVVNFTYHFDVILMTIAMSGNDKQLANEFIYKALVKDLQSDQVLNSTEIIWNYINQYGLLSDDLHENVKIYLNLRNKLLSSEHGFYLKSKRL